MSSIPSKKALLLEEPVVDRDNERVVGFRVEQAVESVLPHGELPRQKNYWLSWETVSECAGLLTFSLLMLRRRLLTILCYGAMMSLAIGINLLPIFLTSIHYSFPGPEGSGLTQEQLGRLGAVAFSGLVVGILITGPLADRFGAKAFALLGNALLAIGLGVTAWSPTYCVLLAATFGLGLGAGILDMVLSPVVANQSGAPSRRHELAAFLLLCWRCCHGRGRHACAPGGPGLARREPASYSVAHCPCLCPRRDELSSPDNRRRRTHSSQKPVAQHLVYRGSWRHLPRGRHRTRHGTMVARICGNLSRLPAVGRRHRSLPFLRSHGRRSYGHRNPQHPNRLLHDHGVGCGLSVVLFLAGSFFPVAPVALLACILVGLTGSCLWPTMLAVTADRYPNGGATMFGALAAFGNAGGIFMPWAVGAIADFSNLHWGLSISALAPLIMFPIVLMLSARRTSSLCSPKGMRVGEP